MLGFGKKKKKEEGEADSPKKPGIAQKLIGKAKKKKGAPEAEEDAPSSPPKKKRITIKRLFFFMLVPAVIGALAWVGYARFFAEKDPEVRVYKPVELAHVNLPPEMMKFTFDHMQVLYDALVAFNSEMILFDGEISRIDAIAQKYPDQGKIANAEKKIWEKSKNTLLKEFSKLEKPIREMYVLFQVNDEQGLARIQEKTGELTTVAEAALTTARSQTEKLKRRTPAPPEGLIQGTLYKVKKKFL